VTKIKLSIGGDGRGLVSTWRNSADRLGNGVVTHGKLEGIRRDLAQNAKKSDELSASSGESHRLTPVPGIVHTGTGAAGQLL
jgi:hypothetical protein